jgi:hypothetical protein
MLSESELALHDGSDPNLPVYIAIKHRLIYSW